MELNLFVYGTLGLGRPNAHVLEKFGGEWVEASVTGRLEERGWGAKMGYKGIVLDADGEEVHGYIFISKNLDWDELDAFEGVEYQRVVSKVKTKGGKLLDSYIYVLRDG